MCSFAKPTLQNSTKCCRKRYNIKLLLLMALTYYPPKKRQNHYTIETIYQVLDTPIFIIICAVTVTFFLNNLMEETPVGFERLGCFGFLCDDLES